MTDDDLPVLELAFPGPLRDSGVAAILAAENGVVPLINDDTLVVTERFRLISPAGGQGAETS